MIKLFILLLLSFFFSGVETAVTAISVPLLSARASKGNKRAKILLELKSKPDKLLGTLLLGNNLVNIALTAISTSMLIDIFGPVQGVALATFGVSFMVLIFAEILPKTYAIRQTLPFAFAVAYPLKAIVFVLSPIVACFNAISKIILKILPKKKNTGDNDLKEEIRGTLAISQNLPERGIIRGVLDLDEVCIGDILTDRGRLASLNVETPVPDILDFLRKTPYSRIPLWEGRRDNIVGILHIKKAIQLVDAWRKNQNTNVRDFCTKPWFVLKSVSLLDQLAAFRKRKEHFAIVVDEYGDIQGVVTLEDLLEEVVGDIADETDSPADAGLRWHLLPDGSYRLNGNATLRDVNRAFHWHLPDDKATTLAGYVMYAAEQIPHVGQQFNIDGWLFTVRHKTGNRLTQIDVLPEENEN